MHEFHRDLAQSGLEFPAARVDLDVDANLMQRRKQFSIKGLRPIWRERQNAFHAVRRSNLQAVVTKSN